MLKIISLLGAIFTLLIVIILSFENLFFGNAKYFILFWQMNGSVTILILLSFLLGIVFGLCVYTFFSSNPLANDDVKADDTSEWK